MLIYSDESGDLGWTFDAPYRTGGSSRHLTIASLIVDESIKHIPKRLISELYNKFKWPTSIEKKWSDMITEERTYFSKGAVKIVDNNKELIKYASITVKKENVD